MTLRSTLPKIIFLLATLTLTSAWSVSDLVGGKYRFRCYMACVDQTSTQNDYVEMRDHCRELAQLKVDMAVKEAGLSNDDKSRKSMLVSLFSQCMATNGWTVPDGKDPSKSTASIVPSPANPISNTAAAAIAPPSAAAAAATKREERTTLTRNTECAFARGNAAVSSISATRAKACDLECDEALKVSPGGPRPAACAPDAPPKYSKGSVD